MREKRLVERIYEKEKNLGNGLFLGEEAGEETQYTGGPGTHWHALVTTT